jgi:hypothetical protein
MLIQNIYLIFQSYQTYKMNKQIFTIVTAFLRVGHSFYNFCVNTYIEFLIYFFKIQVNFSNEKHDQGQKKSGHIMIMGSSHVMSAFSMSFCMKKRFTI